MATATTKTTPTSEMPDLALKFREQLVSTVAQGQQISIDAAQAWVKAVSVIPVPDLPAVPGLANVPSVEAATNYTFGVASDLLNAQRDFTLQLANVLLPVKSV
jgi:hypothetical protein